jgi:hypothetical protein
MGKLIKNIGNIRSIWSAVTGKKTKAADLMPTLAVTGGLLGVTGVFAYFTNKRMKKLGGYIP